MRHVPKISACHFPLELGFKVKFSPFSPVICEEDRFMRASLPRKAVRLLHRLIELLVVIARHCHSGEYVAAALLRHEARVRVICASNIGNLNRCQRYCNDTGRNPSMLQL
jgi:hypothetical protein